MRRWKTSCWRYLRIKLLPVFAEIKAVLQIAHPMPEKCLRSGCRWVSKLQQWILFPYPALCSCSFRMKGWRTQDSPSPGCCPCSRPQGGTNSHPGIPFPPPPYPDLTALVCLHMLLSMACSELLRKKSFLRGKKSLYYKKIVTSKSSRVSKSTSIFFKK